MDSMINAFEKEFTDTKKALTERIEALQTMHEQTLSINEALRKKNQTLLIENSSLSQQVNDLSSTRRDIKNFLASTDLASLFISNDLTIKLFTPAAERLLNIKSHNLTIPLDKNPCSFIDLATLDEAKLVLKNLQPREKEIEVNGQWFLQKILPYRSEKNFGDGVVLTFHDITHLKNAVKRLEASGKQHAVIARLGVEALSTNDMNHFMQSLVKDVSSTLHADLGKVLQYNPSDQSLLLTAGTGWDKNLVGKATIPADKSSQAGFTLSCKSTVIIEDLISEQRFVGTSFLTDHHVVSGMSCVINKGDNPWGVLAVHTTKKYDFTEDDANFLMSAANILSIALHRTSMEAELKESEKRLRIAKNSNQMGSFEFMLDTGALSWDQLIIDIWGLDNQTLTIEDFYRGLHPDDLQHVSESIALATVTSGDGHFKSTYRVINRKTQAITWLEATGQVLFKHNKAYKMIGMVIDITKKMELEGSLKAAVRELQGANEKQNEFLATLGHEIRNPLAAIASGIQIIERDKDQLDRAVNMIQNNVDIVSLLLDDLLDLTRISRGEITLKKETINFSCLVRDIYQSFMLQFEQKQQNVSIHLPDIDIITAVDKTRLQQAIGNIINNANKFTPEGGSISITLRKISNYLEVTVTDSGVGIDMQFKDKIFEPFQQLKQSQSIANSGMGIGLSLVKQFITLHDGSITIQSDGHNHGTTFTLRLPIVMTPERTQQPSQVVESRKEPLSQRILIVDDNEDAAYGLSLILDMKGHKVHTNHTGLSALSDINHVKPDVLILDIGLPDMTGYDLLKTIKFNEKKPMLSIALTGFGHKEAKESSKQAGFDYHLTKPVDIPQLLSILASYNA
jgi:PAS domain S-box-containing protein